jgi:hypothetical protein
LHPDERYRIIGPPKMIDWRTNMPRAKVKFSGGSPQSDLWPSDPEGAMKEIAIANQATYIEGSLVFSTGGGTGTAEALFETVEPEAGSKASRLHRLGAQLDASEVHLYVGPDDWRARIQT